MRRTALLLLAALSAVPGCDDRTGPDASPRLSGRWAYSATELRSASVTCATSSVVMTLVQGAALDVDARFDGSTFGFEIECRRDERRATLFFPEGASVTNGEVEDGRVAFDFDVPDFIHTGTLEDGRMSGTVAARLDLAETPLGDLGVVNLVGDWEAVRR